MKKILAFAAALFCATGAMAQFDIPPVGDPVCAYCGANLPKNEPHSSSCPYYEPPEEEEEESTSSTPSTPVQTQQQSTQQQQTPQHQQTQSTHLSDYTPMSEHPTQYNSEYLRMRSGRWHQNRPWGSERRVVELSEGWGVWDTSRDIWLLEPRYQRIYMPDGRRAVVQLMSNGKWRMKDLDNPRGSLQDYGSNVSVLEAEFDEIKFIDGFPFVALNIKDRFGRNHWRIWQDGKWRDAESVTYQDVEIHKNGYTGKYDLLLRDQQGKWTVELAGSGSVSGLSSVRKTKYGGTYVVGMVINGQEKFNIICNDNLRGLLSKPYDRVVEQNGCFTLTQGGKMGIAMPGNKKGETARLETVVPVEYDYASLNRVHIPDINRDSQYALVGKGDRYAFYSIRYNMQMLPAIFTPTEVQDFETRMMCASDMQAPADVHSRYDATFSTEGRGGFKEYCQGRAKECYQFLTADIITEQEARQTLTESNLRQEYFERQNTLYNRETRLGKYDTATQTFTVETHWGTARLHVPLSQVESVRDAWKQRSRQNVVEYGLDLDRNYNPVLHDLTIRAGGRTYTSK